MQCFAAIETAGIVEIVGTSEEPCGACIAIAREERTVDGLRELRDEWAETYVADGEGG